MYLLTNVLEVQVIFEKGDGVICVILLFLSAFQYEKFLSCIFALQSPRVALLVPRPTYTKQLRSARSSMKSNSWLMSYVIDGLLGFILFRCSSYILHTPAQQRVTHINTVMNLRKS